MRKDSLKLMLEELEFQADVPYTVSRYLAKKYEKDPDFFAAFFGEPELYKKWRLNPISGLRSLPKKPEGEEHKGEPDPVDIMLAKSESAPGQSGKDTRREILNFWVQQITGKESAYKVIDNPDKPDEKKRVLDVPEEELKQAKEKAKAEIYNRIWKGIPPDIILHRLTIPDQKLDKLIKFIGYNLVYPDADDPKYPKLGDPNYEDKKQSMDSLKQDLYKFRNKMYELTPVQRARYLFNIMVFAKGGPKKKDVGGAPERASFKAAKTDEPATKPPFIGKPKTSGKKKIYTHPFSIYKSKKKRGLEDDDK